MQHREEVNQWITLADNDCIVAATSIILDAILLTDDRNLLNLSWPGLQTQSIL